MIEAWLFVIFCLSVCIPIMISERKAVSKREKYDVIVKRMFELQLKDCEIPQFMNRLAWQRAHKEAIQIVQEGNLDLCYRMIQKEAL